MLKEVKDLTGYPLDYALALALCHRPMNLLIHPKPNGDVRMPGVWIGNPDGMHSRITYDNVVMMYGLIVRERIHLCPVKLDGVDAWQSWVDHTKGQRVYGPEPKIAVARAFTTYRMGREVEIPSALLQGRLL